MGNNWTPEQLEAITQRDCNLLVAAAAGAGKTAVLVERIIRKITDSKKPVDIDRLLVVTFTNAAATEMRERIGSALADALEAEPSSANLQKQMVLLDRASIMTLHSFCMEVVKSHFHSLDLDPVFRIADETESSLMKLEALDELFEDKYENEDSGSEFFRLVESYGGGRDDSSLRDIVLSLHRFTRSHPWPEQWLATQAEAFNIGASACLSSTLWASVLLKGAAAELQGLMALLHKAAALASRAQGLEPYSGVLGADIVKLEELLELCRSSSTDWDRIHSAFMSYEPLKLPRCGKNVDTAVQDEVKTIRKTVKDKLKKLGENGFNASDAEVKEDFRKLYPIFKYLSSMVCELEDKYLKKKKDKGLLDFNDLEHYCLKVLLNGGKPTVEAIELREKYEEILVDEYQDSNLIQELILNTVSGNDDGRHNIFMVGDVKQSIYRFRQAKPELFLKKYTTYPHESGHDSRVIQLYKNFRSRTEVINGVNFVFSQIMSDAVGELDYTDEEALNPGAVFEEAGQDINTGGPVEVHIIDVTSAQSEILSENVSEVSFSNISGDIVNNNTNIIPGSNFGGQNPDMSLPLINPSPASQTPGYPAPAFPAPASQTLSHPTTAYPEPPNQIPGHPASTDTSDAGNLETDNAGNTDEGDEESIDNIQAEARIAGKRIKSLVSHGSQGFSVYDKKLAKYRPVEYRDIVILMRATRNWSDVFTDELAAMGIPAYADTGMGYFKTVEVETILSLLKIIDNPLQDIPMLAVLRSPVGGFETDDLADIRLADRNASIYEAMKIFSGYTQYLPDEQSEETTAASTEDCQDKMKCDTVDDTCNSQEKAINFLKKLKSWRDASQYTPTDELIWQLLTETGFYSYAGAMPGGAERQANLRMLFEKARQYEETSYKGLFNFVNFIEKMTSGGGDMGSAKLLGENDNVVRIMSIHKSKGLEFPVVIVAGCGKKFNMMDLNAGILLHQELGYGPDLVDLDKMTITSTLSKFAIRQKLRLETLSEEMRILYVAFTRAKEKLIMTGCVRDIGKTCAKWCAIADTEEEKLSQYDMQQAATYLDWIGPAIARHESASPIRQSAANCSIINLIQNDSSSWNVKLWGIGAAAVKKEAAAARENLWQWLEADTSLENKDYSAEQLVESLDWQYPYEVLARMPAKLTVTELKRHFADEAQVESAMPFKQPIVGRPLFMEPEKGLGAARKGTVMHFVMQHLNLQKLAAVMKLESTTAVSAKATADTSTGATTAISPEASADNLTESTTAISTKATADTSTEATTDTSAQTTAQTALECALISELAEQLSSMVENEQLSAAEAEVVNLKAVSGFFKTPLGSQILCTPGVRRETAFNIEIKCTEIYKDLPKELYENEIMLLQGVIDCWFETEAGLVLLDYKTDFVPDGGSDAIKERYRVQLDYYSWALEQITGKKVAEKYLYLFYNGELLKIPGN